MKHSQLLFAFAVFATACNSPQSASISELDLNGATKPQTQIGQYVVESFEDSKGNLYFGTLSKGMAKYDGKTLKYLSVEDGMPSTTMVSMVEDKKGNFWLATQEGLSYFDGKTFKNYFSKDGLCSDRMSFVFMDSKERLWFGTWNGICVMKDGKFENFELPNPDEVVATNSDTKDWITVIMEDSKGNMWFGCDGIGALKFDGETFTQFSKKDGLYSNNVQSIVEDGKGNIWFASRVAEKDLSSYVKNSGDGGISVFDGERIFHFEDVKGLHHDDTYLLFEDSQSNIWISTIENGVYRYDGKEFTNYQLDKAVVSMLETAKGEMYFGCSGGLYKLLNGNMINITVENFK